MEVGKEEEREEEGEKMEEMTKERGQKEGPDKSTNMWSYFADVALFSPSDVMFFQMALDTAWDFWALVYTAVTFYCTCLRALAPSAFLRPSWKKKMGWSDWLRAVIGWRGR